MTKHYIIGHCRFGFWLFDAEAEAYVNVDTGKLDKSAYNLYREEVQDMLLFTTGSPVYFDESAAKKIFGNAMQACPEKSIAKLTKAEFSNLPKSDFLSKISDIKVLRTMFPGVGLKEAKDAVELLYASKARRATEEAVISDLQAVLKRVRDAGLTQSYLVNEAIRNMKGGLA
jgi:ribosomal protein L7/L12